MVKTKGKKPYPRESFSMSYLNDKIYIFGGSVNKESTNDFYSLDLLSSTWSNLSSIPDLPSKRQSHQSISHGSKMYILGGCETNYTNHK